MKLDELFSSDIPKRIKEETSEMVSATENYIITRLSSLKAEGRIESITTEQLNNELESMGTSSPIMTLDPMHLEQFVKTLEPVEDVRQTDDTVDGNSNFEIFLKYRHDKDEEEVEKAEKKVSANAQKALKKGKSDDKKSAATAKSAGSLEL